MSTISPQLPVDTGQAALVMAVAIVLQRLTSLSREDREDAYRLLKTMPLVQSPEELEEIREALVEILDQEPMTSQPLPTEIRRPEKLSKWSEHVGAAIKRLREERGWTQAQLAEKAGLTDQGYVSRVEAGAISPSRRTVERVAQALGVTIGQLDPTED